MKVAKTGWYSKKKINSHKVKSQMHSVSWKIVEAVMFNGRIRDFGAREAWE